MTDTSDPDNPEPMPTDSSVTLDELKTWIKNTNKYKEGVRKKVREIYLAMMFLKKANREKYGGLWTSLKNNYNRGTK